MPRLPLVVTGLVLLLLGTLAFLLQGTPQQPLLRTRPEPARPAPKVVGLEPATAPIREPSRLVRTAIEPSQNRIASNGTPTTAPAAEPQPTWLAARLVREGRPLAGLELALVPDGKGRRQSVRTDENGRFRRVLPFAGNWTLRAEGSDLSVHQTEWTVRIEDGRPFDLGDLIVRPRVRLSGRVLRPDGTPLPHAIVRGTAGNGELELPALRVGDDGAFAWLDVPPGEVKLHAEGEAVFARAVASIDDAHGEVERDLAARVRATVRWTLRDDDGRPTAGARVEPLDPASVLDPTATADDAGHVELATAVGARLRITREGCVPVELVVDASEDERRVVLLREREVRGTLGAIGKGAALHVGLAAGATADSPCAAVLAREHRSNDDGTFSIPSLVAGRYTIRAVGDGFASPLRELTLPGDELLALEAVPGRVATLRIHDERELPVPFARVLADGRTWLADRTGTVAVAVAGTAPIQLAVDLEGHLPTSTEVVEGTVATVRLPRAARFDGRVLGYRQDLPYALRVLAWRERDGQQKAFELELDADGRFDLQNREPGPYVIAVERKDRSRAGGDGAVLPLLFDGIDSRATTRVDARGGERTEVLLPLPDLVTVRGRVTQGGRPVAGAVVFAVPHGDEPPPPFDRSPLGFDHVGAPARCPRTTTGADGSFTMLVGRPGRLQLRSRTAAQPFVSAPLEVAVRGYGDEPIAELALPTGGVTGRFAVDGKGEAVRAFLVPLADAARDPFRAAAGERPDAAGRQSVPVAADGSYAFLAVPEGTYLLRFTRGDAVLRQRTLRVDRATADAGLLAAAPATKPARLPFAGSVPNGARAVLLALLPECPDGAFAARTAAAQSISLVGLAAGRYRLVVLDASGAVLGEDVFELRGDGSTVRPSLASLR